MSLNLTALKTDFRAGRHAQAIAGCEALCQEQPGNLEAVRACAMMHALIRNTARSLELLRQVHALAPDDADVLFNIGMCEKELKDFSGASQSFQRYTRKFPAHAHGWASLADCKFRLGAFDEGIALADAALRLDPVCAPAWAVRAGCQKAAGRHADALASYAQAIRLAPADAEPVAGRAELHEMMGDAAQAAVDYEAALALDPDADHILKQATLCLLHLDRGQDAIALCHKVLQVRPDSLTAKLGAEWLLSQMVPLWHVPMMNEDERNQPYHDALAAAVSPEKTVFEVGTGSGLLAMMAARLGARKVHTCEAVPLVAQTARKIVADNGLQDRIEVLSMPSYQVQVGKHLPERADILVHEVFSSELLGEHVLPALEDAKARLLKPGGKILPASASIMVALVGGEELGRELHVGKAFGFDLSAFNAIHPRKRPIHREDLPRLLLSGDIEAFRFDFQNQDAFPAERKAIAIPVTASGLCWGLVQWIRFDFGGGCVFENHPSRQRPVASWQHTIYRFDEPAQLEAGSVVDISAMHDRARPWFERT